MQKAPENICDSIVNQSGTQTANLFGGSSTIPHGLLSSNGVLTNTPTRSSPTTDSVFYGNGDAGGSGYLFDADRSRAPLPTTGNVAPTTTGRITERLSVSIPTQSSPTTDKELYGSGNTSCSG